MIEIVFSEYKRIREENNLPVKEKCALCGKKFKNDALMHSVESGDNYKFVCSSCNGKEEKNANNGLHTPNIEEKEYDTTGPSKQDEPVGPTPTGRDNNETENI